MKNDNCCFCGDEIKGFFVTAGQGKSSCQLCWHIRSKPRPILTFNEILNMCSCGEDSDIFMNLICASMPWTDGRKEFISNFNKKRRHKWQQKLELLVRERTDRNG